MEPAKIDWKNLEWRFVEDELYEHINAPKWFDFLSPLDQSSLDDDAWFCRPDCNHPKTAQDFLKSTPTKLSSPAGVPEISPLGHRNQRDVKVKRRGLLAQAWLSPNKFNEDSENQNPNLSTPPYYNNQAKIIKAAFKSSAEKKDCVASDEAMLLPPPPRLKTTLSARNLFAGRDILNQITEFCSELKRMATRTKERQNEEIAKESLVKEESNKSEVVLNELNLRGKEKPFQEMEGSILKEKPRRKKRGDTENIPISVNLENVKRKEDSLLQIRTNPPSPQCFSATRKTAPSKSKLMERGVLQEQNKQTVVAKEESSIDKNKSASIVDSREARTLDVFWFLKPCTLSTYNNA